MAKEIAGSREYLIGKNVYVYRPAMSPKFWWISYKVPGAKRRHESLKTSDKTQAIMVADNHYETRRVRFAKMGIAAFKSKSTMEECFAHFLKFIDQKDMVRSEERAKTIKSHWERFFIPYYGAELEVSAHSPTKEQLANYKEWRRGKTIGGRKGYKPADGKRARMGKLSMAMEALSLKQVWARAKKAGIIDSYPDVPVDIIDAKTREASSSVEFLPQEIPELIKNFEDWCIHPDLKPKTLKQKTHWQKTQGSLVNLRPGYNSFHWVCRERMFCFAMLLLATSTRPKTLRKLCWQDIQEKVVDGNKMYAFDFKHSKVNRPYVGVAWGFNIDVEQVLNRWKKVSPTHFQKNHAGLRVFDVVFRVKAGEKNPSWHEWTDYSSVFNRFLGEYKMLKHPTDPKKRRKNRAIYSLRSTSITLRAKSGLPIAVVADQANSSIDMIQKHYFKRETEGLMKTLAALPSVDMSSATVTPISKGKRKSGKKK